MQTYFVLSIGGQKAVDAGYRFCGGSCYRGVYTHNERLGQLEVVVDDSGEYNGLPNKWVDVSYIPTEAALKSAIKALKKLGFSGCYCFATKTVERDDFTVETEEGDLFTL